jgi:hypothetical protein
MRLLQYAIEQKADHFVLWLELGQCQQALGLLTPARNSFGIARQLNPSCTEISMKLASLSNVGMAARFRDWLRRSFSR